MEMRGLIIFVIIRRQSHRHGAERLPQLPLGDLLGGRGHGAHELRRGQVHGRGPAHELHELLHRDLKTGDLPAQHDSRCSAALNGGHCLRISPLTAGKCCLTPPRNPGSLWLHKRQKQPSFYRGQDSSSELGAAPLSCLHHFTFDFCHKTHMRTL